MSEDAVRRLASEHTYGRQLGFLGEPRVNIVELNLDLDAQRNRRGSLETPGAPSNPSVGFGGNLGTPHLAQRGFPFTASCPTAILGPPPFTDSPLSRAKRYSLASVGEAVADHRDFFAGTAALIGDAAGASQRPGSTPTTKNLYADRLATRETQALISDERWRALFFGFYTKATWRAVLVKA